MPEPHVRLSAPTRLLHWLLALSMIGLFLLGQRMHHDKLFELYPIHKSLGMLVLVFAVIRAVWRLREGWPDALGKPTPGMAALARAVHWTLLLCTLLLPISGMMMSGAGGHGLSFFGFELLAANPDPAKPGEFLALNGPITGIGHVAHGLLGKLLLLALVLHVAGALKHHFIDRDATLRRMISGRA